jgi:hypothetical protein
MTVTEPEPTEPPEPEPEPELLEEEPVDEGTVCEVCGRKGRAEGHH